MNVERFLTISLILLLVAPAAPALPQGINIPALRGRVVEWVWRGEIIYQVEESIGYAAKSELSAHYLVVLDLAGSTAEEVEAIRNVTALAQFRHPIMDKKLSGQRVVLWLPSNRWREMREDASLTITDYRYWDGVGSCKSVLIDGNTPTDAGKLFEIVTPPSR